MPAVPPPSSNPSLSPDLVPYLRAIAEEVLEHEHAIETLDRRLAALEAARAEGTSFYTAVAAELEGAHRAREAAERELSRCGAVLIDSDEGVMMLAVKKEALMLW